MGSLPDGDSPFYWPGQDLESTGPADPEALKWPIPGHPSPKAPKAIAIVRTGGVARTTHQPTPANRSGKR
jgi:hypothetical protein